MTEERIEGYANALVEVARAEGRLEQVEEELFRFASALERSDDLRSALTDQTLPPARRQAIVEDLLGGRATPTTTALVSFVVAAGRGRDLPAIVERVVQRASAERGAEVAEVRTAVPLDDDRRARLARALSSATGKNVEVRIIVDPSVIGGVVAQIGDTVIDGSVRTRLDRLKERL
jgi:F-type H+-transporting ATPase subunit delta